MLKDGKIHSYKDEGLVLDVFKSIENPETYMGNSVIGHTRYTTAGDKKKYNYQPFFAKNEYDQIILSIAHNGNLTNARILKKNWKKKVLFSKQPPILKLFFVLSKEPGSWASWRYKSNYGAYRRCLFRSRNDP